MNDNEIFICKCGDFGFESEGITVKVCDHKRNLITEIRECSPDVYDALNYLAENKEYDNIRRYVNNTERLRPDRVSVIPQLYTVTEEIDTTGVYPVVKKREVKMEVSNLDTNSMYPDSMDFFSNNMAIIAKRFNDRNEAKQHTDYHAAYISHANYVENMFKIKHVNFKDRTTIVVWEDGTITKVNCQEGDEFSKEVGIAMCIAKRAYGGNSRFNDYITELICRQEKAERRKAKKVEKRGRKKSERSIEESKENKEETVNSSGIYTSWCTFENDRPRNYISYTFYGDNDGKFARAKFKDYKTGIEYDIFEHSEAIGLKECIKNKDYDSCRIWFNEFFTVKVDI